MFNMKIRRPILLSPETGEDGASGGQDPKPVESPDGSTGAEKKADTASLDALKKQNEELQAALKKAEEFSGRIKDAEKKEREKRQEAQKEQGEFKALAESLEKEREELRSQMEETQRLLQESAKKSERAERIEQALKAKVDARMENGLPDYLKNAVGKVSTVEDQLAIIEEFDRAQGNLDPVNKPSSLSGNPSGGGGAILTPTEAAKKIASNEMTLEEYKASESFTTAVQSGGAPAKPSGSFFERMFKGSAGHRKG